MSAITATESEWMISSPEGKIEISAEPLEFSSDVVLVSTSDERLQKIQGELDALNRQIASTRTEIDDLDVKIDQYTNHADALDYSVAIGSGVLCGLVDSFFVGEFNIAEAKKWSNDRVETFVKSFADRLAKKKGEKIGSQLNDKIAFLEKTFKNPVDDVWKGKNIHISMKSHHLDDWTHHPSLLGLCCSILTQFIKKGFFTNSEGMSFWLDADNGSLVGGNAIEKIFAGTVNWFGHLVSDMAGTSGITAGAGMGIPGSLLSLVRELAQLPGVKNSKLPKYLHDAFVKNNFDFRSELAVAHELGRQALPVLMNEAFVRLFYLFRRLAAEVRERGWKEIRWKKTLPFRNRTITRMMTIASGTFLAVDMADAAIRGALGAGGIPHVFLVKFLLRINYVGVARFTVAVATDLCQGCKRSKLVDERIMKMTEMIWLLDAKVSYLDAGVWIQVKETGAAVQEMIRAGGRSVAAIQTDLVELDRSIGSIGDMREDVERNNPGLIDGLLDVLE